MREDLARLARMRDLAREASDFHAFLDAVLRLDWTRDNARTHELRGSLEALAQAVYARERQGAKEDEEERREARVIEAWNELHRVRLERLVGCLAGPLPKPEEG